MIWHAFEVWLLLFAAFVVGSIAGAGLHLALARSAAAGRQEALADALGTAFDRLGRRLGLRPGWRPGDPYERHYHDDLYADRLPAAREVTPAADHPEDAWSYPEADRLPPPAADAGQGRPPLPEAEALDDGEVATAWDGEPAWDDYPEAEEPYPLEDGEDRRQEADIVEDQLRPHAELPTVRPAGLAAPRNGVPDDLQRIRGIGRKNEEFLNSLGIFHFGQIAAWTPAEARWVAAQLSFPERIERDDWIGQATILATGGDTGYVKAARKIAADAAYDEREYAAVEAAEPPPEADEATSPP